MKFMKESWQCTCDVLESNQLIHIYIEVPDIMDVTDFSYKLNNLF